VPSTDNGAQKYEEAYNKGDAKTLVGLYSDDVYYVDQDGEEVRGRDAMEKLLAEGTDQSETDGWEIIGWDPIGRQIRSWIFDSNGGFGEAKTDSLWARGGRGGGGGRGTGGAGNKGFPNVGGGAGAGQLAGRGQGAGQLAGRGQGAAGGRLQGAQGGQISNRMQGSQLGAVAGGALAGGVAGAGLANLADLAVGPTETT